MVLLLVAFYAAYIVVNNLQTALTEILNTPQSATLPLEYATFQAIFLGVMAGLGYACLTQGLSGIRRQEQLDKEGNWSETVVGLRQQPKAAVARAKAPASRVAGAVVRPRQSATTPISSSAAQQTQATATPVAQVVTQPGPTAPSANSAPAAPVEPNAEIQAEKPVRWEGDEPEPVERVEAIAETKEYEVPDTTSEITPPSADLQSPEAPSESISAPNQALEQETVPEIRAEPDVVAAPEIRAEPEVVAVPEPSPVEVQPAEPTETIVSTSFAQSSIPEPTVPVAQEVSQPVMATVPIVEPPPVIITAYCVKCRMMREIMNPQNTVLKNGRNAVKGQCPVCGINLTRIMRN